MFVRRLKNRSGSVSIQLISKAHGRYKVIKTLGTAKDPDEIERLWLQAQHIVNTPDSTQGKLFAMQTQADHVAQNTIESLSNTSIRTIGPELIFGTLFDRIGFNAIADNMFRHLVIARLAYPLSKLKTADYLYRYQGKVVSVSAIYKFLDRLNKRYKSQAQEIAYRHTQTRLKNISVVFYDITTLYFEAEDEDDLRKIGFSKDGKFQNPQIMLGLLVGEGGLPIGYDIFKGNTFEGHTLLPTLKKIQQKYGFDEPIVVADAAMLSADNLRKLREANYRFIVGGRIKNENDQIKTQIIKQAHGMRNGDNFVLEKENNTRLVITYSDKRASKDKYNRERGLRLLRQRVKTGRLSKSAITNRGYNKFLKLEGELLITIDEEKVKADSVWDGLKGYITNTNMSAGEIVENYKHLWQIEKAFRISKTDLKVRPIYHYRQRRIEAHICIAFVAYAIYKELENLLVKRGIKMSVNRAGELTHNMYELHYKLPDSNRNQMKVLNMSEEQQSLYDAIFSG